MSLAVSEFLKLFVVGVLKKIKGIMDLLISNQDHTLHSHCRLEELAAIDDAILTIDSFKSLNAFVELLAVLLIRALTTLRKVRYQL